ncbi:MAG: DUF4252 domain-containing protein [Bacteroidales bacterium]|nr:DUF4252 domain-containing protein [Bacteroidales bacterium]
MKKLGIFISLMALSVLLNAQDLVDDLIKKYEGKKGFTSIAFNGSIFSFKTEGVDSGTKIDNIRIVTKEQEKDWVNFCDELEPIVKASSYVELMRVREQDENVVFYAKYANKKMVELLLIAEGTSESAVISIKGKMNMKDLASISTVVDYYGFGKLSLLDEN